MTHLLLPDPARVSLLTNRIHSYVQRTWLILEHLSIPYQYIEVNPYHKAPEFLRINPRGLVPALGVPQTVSRTSEAEEHAKLKPLYESLVLCDYLDSAYTSPKTSTPSLYPQDDYERARMHIWIDWVSKKICPAFYRLLQHDSSASYSLEEARENLANVLVEWVKEADTDGPFWNGKEVSMVDICLAPWNERWNVIDHYKTGGVGIPYVSNYGSRGLEQALSEQTVKEEDKQVWERWVRWSEAMSECDFLKRTLSEHDMLLANYKRYAENQTGSEVGQATRDGKALP